MDGNAIIPRGVRLDGLTGLRAAAALWVLSYHYGYGLFGSLMGGHAPAFISVGYLGVDLFFILSGFVIWHVHGAELARPRVRTMGRFLSLRLARLYPVHLFTLLLLAVLVLVRPLWGDPIHHPLNYSGSGFLVQLGLVQAWGFAQNETWNYPSWSVSAEWFCYLVCPLIALGVARCGPRGTIAGIVLMLAVVAVSFETVFGGSMNQSIGVQTLLRAAPDFAIGCLLRRLASERAVENWPWTAIVAGFSVLWAASFATALPVGLFALPMFIVVVCAAASETSLVARFLSLRPLVAIGAASYSLYMMQAPVQFGADMLRRQILPGTPWRDAGLAVAILAILGVSTVLVHLWVENPARRVLRGWIDRWLPKEARGTRPAVASGARGAYRPMGTAAQAGETRA